MFLFLSSVILISGCATARAPSARRSPLELADERIALLTQQLDDRDDELERVRRDMKRLRHKESHKKNDPGFVVPSVPARQLSPTETPDFIVEDLEQDDPGNQERSLADSRFEAMHLYHRALRLFEAKHYDEAIAPLRQFLTENPEHVYADRAEFLIAECQFANKEFELAALAFARIETKYPYSIKVPESIYQRGLCFLNLGQGSQARAAFRDLARRFPKDEWAKKSTQRLAEFTLQTPFKVPSLAAPKDADLR